MTIHFTWRITKYNPKYRDEKCIYLRDEWTSISEIGRITNNHVILTIQDYISTENRYVEAILDVMSCLDIQKLSIFGLEKWEDTLDTTNFSFLYNENMKSLYGQVTNGLWLEKDQISDLSRLILREKIWCKLKFDSKMYVHFGYDFYMFIGSEMMCEDTINNIEKSGLYVEDFISPIKEED